jgi:DNA modification methylase
MEGTGMDIVYRKPNELIGAEYNPRQLTQKEHQDLTDSIKRFGLVDPILVNSNSERKDVVIGGHQRLAIAKELGIKEVPTVEHDLSYEKEKELNVRLNKNTGSWDWDVLANEFDLEQLVDIGFDEADLNFDIEVDEVVEDEAPEVGKDAVSELGKIYYLGKHRVMCGDSTSADDVALLMDGVKADLLHTDPPYGIDYDGGSKKRDKIENDSIPVLDFYTDFLSLARLHCKDGASAYVWHASSETHNAINAFINAGWQYKQYIIWNKNNATFGRQDFHWKHEPAIYGWGQGSHSWYGDRKQTTVWDIDRPSTAEEHPTMKPVELCLRAIGFNTKSKDEVLDLFLGSGSTLIACEQANRVCYGMELEPKYVDVIRKRWAKFVYPEEWEDNWQELTPEVKDET